MTLPLSTPDSVSQLAAMLPLDTTRLPPGTLLAVALSGGADSVALARTLHSRATELGLVLHLAHLHHGLRGSAADADQEFCRALAVTLGLPFHTTQIDTAAEARSNAESIEEAARRLRYAWLRSLMATQRLDAVATAHTLDDQAETVLGKFLRGAWTEGLSAIHPVVHFPEGRLIRPILALRRAQVLASLAALGQSWCEDASNNNPAFTRNRIRHELLPQLDQWNPQLRQHLANMAILARDEEAYWDAEIARLAPQLLLTGRPVRGGGRASGTPDQLALDVVRLAALAPAVQRRLLRHAARQFGVSLGFDASETLRRLATEGRSGQQATLPGPLLAERTPRELRLSPNFPAARVPEQRVVLPVPGEAVAFGFRFQAISAQPQPDALIRASRPGDRVTLRYSSGPRKIKEVLERLNISAADRAHWPVVSWAGQILWMRGVELQTATGWQLHVEPENAH